MFLLHADLLFRRPINDLIAASENHDVVLAMGEGVYRGKTYRKFRVASGFVLFRRSGYGLIDSWCDMLSRTEAIEDVRPWGWFWERTSLLDAVEKTGLDILQMPEKCLSSPRFEPDAWVWSANVPTSEKQTALQLFAAELMRFTNEGKADPRVRASDPPSNDRGRAIVHSLFDFRVFSRKSKIISSPRAAARAVGAAARAVRRMRSDNSARRARRDRRFEHWRAAPRSSSRN